MKIGNMLYNWIKAYWGLVFGAGVFIILILGFVSSTISVKWEVSENYIKQQQRAAAFYQECLQDHERYECDALWGSAYKTYRGTE